MKPKDFVLTIHPDARCKLAGPGVYRVFAKEKCIEKCIGFGELPNVAWKDASDSCKNLQPKTAN